MPPQGVPQAPAGPPPGMAPGTAVPPPGMPPAQPPGPPGAYYQGAPQYGQPAGPPPATPRKKGRRIALFVVIMVVVLAAIAAAGFGINQVLSNNKSSTAAKDLKLSSSRSYQEALFDIQHYFYRDYSEAKITAAANAAVAKEKAKGVKSVTALETAGLRSLLAALGDPHTDYLTPGENKRLAEDISGSFYGVGFMLREDAATKRPKVFSVIPSSPADKAGVKKDDIILSVDGKDTKGQSLDLVVSNIRGKNGTKVALKIQRAGQAKPLTFNITREKIQIPEIESKMLANNQGYIKLYSFDRGVGTKVATAVKDLQAQGAKGFIFDLRNNPGGLLDEAVNVSSVFIPDGTIVSYQTKGQSKVNESATGGAVTNLPLVVLTNGGSASSSEITAGALKDRGRATLVGSKTYGKGSVQKIYELANTGAAKITVALYYLPNGESIDSKGITPDVVVENPADAAAEDQQQLDKATQVLQNLINGQPATGMVLRPAA